MALEALGLLGWPFEILLDGFLVLTPMDGAGTFSAAGASDVGTQKAYNCAIARVCVVIVGTCVIIGTCVVIGTCAIVHACAGACTDGSSCRPSEIDRKEMEDIS